MLDKIERKIRQAEAKRKYKRNNKEKIRKSNKIYKDNNKEKIKECNRISYQRNKNRIKEWKEKNKQKVLFQQRNCIKQKRLKVTGYKLNIGCQICGYNKCSDALDFHHILSENKIKNVNKLREGNWEKFLLEAKKCIIVCKNCHAEMHYNQRNNLE